MASPRSREARDFARAFGEASDVATAAINAAEIAIAESGVEALTIRDLTIATGYSSVSIRDACGSRAALIGRTWLRAYRRFLALLTSLVEETGGDPAEKAFAAAEATILYPRQYPRSAALLAAVSRDELMCRPLPAEIFRQLCDVDSQFGGIMRRLSTEVWNRDDADAVDVMSACVIDLPRRILGRDERNSLYVVREYLRAAVRGILDCGPPPVVRQPADGVRLSLQMGYPIGRYVQMSTLLPVVVAASSSRRA